jgi:REP element-mobilizing transposase RayT
MTLPQRKRLHPTPPDWIGGDSIFFITICCAHRSRNSLANSDVFDVLVSAAKYYIQSEKWWIHLLLAMPDHFHAIVFFGQQKPMDKLVSDWKRYVAKTAKVRWQDGFFEHRLRSNESLDEKTSHIRMNPVRANLSTTPEAWPYYWSPYLDSPAR